MNQLDGMAGRKVWCSYLDKESHLRKVVLCEAELRSQHPVKHRGVTDARAYRWCSAEWFFREADEPFYRTISSFKIDRVNVCDDFD